ncbi:SMI1/KNR4 family protein [Clostridium aciditolerans]|uniref:SMI1/KNR4 family protein n=1 Tax=Clostridium aciditolerans TaxID=339861 RepID=A0A934I103_9CLOT|nr:SMI1/KNR4 family protein [Clostridium aciditolerans]MBI6874792.1 SMI1/KNR4 family protein [Clostridium aciditolerans]
MDKHKTIINKIQNYLIKNGFDEDKINNAFSPCLDKEKLKSLTDLHNFFSYWSSVFYEEDGELLALKNYKVPNNVISFYESFEPGKIPQLGGGVDLLDLNGIKEENCNLSPGAYLIQYGLITFATTVGGNVICMDLNTINNSEPRIIYADKSWFLFNEQERKLEFSFYPFEIQEEDEFLTQSIIKKYMPEISSTFTEFLEMLCSEDEWDAEDYYEKVGNKVEK